MSQVIRKPDGMRYTDDLQSRIERLERLLAGDVESRLVILEAEQPARIDFGSSGITGNISAGQLWEMNHTDGSLRRFVITSPYDAWIWVHFHTIVFNNSSPQAWGRVDGWIDVSPAPPQLPGNTAGAFTIYGREAHPNNPAMLSWVSINSHAWVPLTADIEYTFKPIIQPQSAAPWQAYRDPTYSYFEHGGLRRRF